MKSRRSKRRKPTKPVAQQPPLQVQPVINVRVHAPIQQAHRAALAVLLLTAAAEGITIGGGELASHWLGGSFGGSTKAPTKESFREPKEYSPLEAAMLDAFSKGPAGASPQRHRYRLVADGVDVTFEAPAYLLEPALVSSLDPAGLKIGHDEAAFERMLAAEGDAYGAASPFRMQFDLRQALKDKGSKVEELLGPHLEPEQAEWLKRLGEKAPERVTLIYEGEVGG